MNTYFGNIGNNLGKTCTYSHCQSSVTSSIPSALNSFFLNPMTCTEVNKLILNLDESKSNSPDQPQNKLKGDKQSSAFPVKWINSE